MAATAIQTSLNQLDAMLSDLGGGRGKTGSQWHGQEEPPRPPEPRDYRAEDSSPSSSRAYAVKLPRVLLPPKLQHILDENRRHNLVKFEPRDEGIMKAPEFPGGGDGGASRQQAEESDYDYSTLHPPESSVPEVSDEELENVDAGEAPRGDKSMIIDTEHGQLRSKYNYMGFGLWEDTDPSQPPPPPRRPSPPTPPPKAETVWYNCTVSTARHTTSKELDDLFHDLDGMERMPRRNAEVGRAGEGVPGCLGELHEPFEKEDMSEMFSRAFLEKLALGGSGSRYRYRCHVCRGWIEGRIITAMSHKFHPECFVCQYCRNPFKERSFKSDSEGRPYCHQCFEKLLGHFGSAHFQLKELP